MEAPAAVPADTLESLHKACGSVEVAKDLLGRSASLYAQAARAPDREVVQIFATAVKALASVVEALEAQLRKTSLGPAA